MTTQGTRGADTNYLVMINRYLGTAGRPAGPRPPLTTRHTVVVGADDTAAAALAVDHAAIEAELRGWDLRVVHAQPPATTTPGPGTTLLERMCDRVRAGTDSLQVASRLVAGQPVSCLLDEATAEDLLVVGAGHTHATGLLTDAISAGVAARHRGPVLVVRMPGLPLSASWAARPVVTGYDGSPWSERAVRFALEEARLRGSELSVLWSLPPGMSAADARHRAARFDAEADRVGVVVRMHRVDGSARHRFVLESEYASAMVVGARGTDGVTGRLLGSVSQALLREARCPVFIIH